MLVPGIFPCNSTCRIWVKLQMPLRPRHRRSMDGGGKRMFQPTSLVGFLQGLPKAHMSTMVVLQLGLASKGASRG